MQKNELREEKTSLKSDIENLNAQYQQRVRIIFPWTAIDHSVVISPPYSYPVPIPIPPAPISIHPSLQPFTFFGNQNPGHIPNPCSIYVPYSTPTNPPVKLPSTMYASTSHASNQKESRSKSPGHRRSSGAERSSESHDVATELELKMLGSSSTQQDCTSGGRKGKMKDRTIIGGSASSLLHFKDFKIAPTAWVTSQRLIIDIVYGFLYHLTTSCRSYISIAVSN